MLANHKPAVTKDAKAFSAGEASGYSTFSLFLILAIIFEAVPAHFLLAHWGQPLAWITTGLTLYALIWLVLLRRSLRERPILVEPDRLLVRLGSLWEIEIARDQIARWGAWKPSLVQQKSAGYLSLVRWNDPQWFIELVYPTLARGPFGIRKKVTKLALAVDDPERFRHALAELVRDPKPQA